MDLGTYVPTSTVLVFLSFLGDLEVDRLLNEIDDAAKLLPYLMEKDHTTSVSQDVEQAVRPYKVENARLKRLVWKLLNSAK